MATQLCIFEDTFHTRLFPLIYFRPVYNLRCGILSLKEKIQCAYPGVTTTLHCREYLADYMGLRNPGTAVNEMTADSCLFVNGRVVADRDFAKKVPLDGSTDTVFVNGENVVAARISGVRLKELRNKLSSIFSTADFDGIVRKEVDAKVINYPWELVGNNGEQLREDFSRLMMSHRIRKHRGKVYSGAYLLNKNEIFIDEGTAVKPGVVIDAEQGPVYIGRDVTILPHTTIIGPAYIGDRSVIKVGAHIYEDTSIGPVCKVGGEVEASIIHGYSNKQHDGFLGHAYIGTWVNLGADTINSDLKNNYGSVKVYINGEQIDSGTQFVGVTMGDHSKSAINSMFNTGTVIGVSCNIFGHGFPPKYVPSFSWGAAGETFTTYSIDRAIEVAKRVMGRRKMTLTEIEDKLFRKIFALTSGERRKRGMPA